MIVRWPSSVPPTIHASWRTVRYSFSVSIAVIRYDFDRKRNKHSVGGPTDRDVGRVSFLRTESSDD